MCLRNVSRITHIQDKWGAINTQKLLQFKKTCLPYVYPFIIAKIVERITNKAVYTSWKIMPFFSHTSVEIILIIQTFLKSSYT